MTAIIDAQMYLDFTNKIRAAEGNKELQSALIDDYLDNGESATDIIKALLAIINN